MFDPYSGLKASSFNKPEAAGPSYISSSFQHNKNMT